MTTRAGILWIVPHFSNSVMKNNKIIIIIINNDNNNNNMFVCMCVRVCVCMLVN